MDVDLLPPPSEETLPTVRERRMHAIGAERFARESGRVVVSQNDGTKAVVPRRLFVEATALAIDGKLSEIANGIGTSPKPANPTHFVYVADEHGVEIRTVLVDTPEKVAAALVANPTGIVIPNTAENAKMILDARWLDFINGRGD